MSCYRLWGGFQTPEGVVKFASPSQVDGKFLRLPCGRCFGCRMERARMWAIRCSHEAKLWDSSFFVTLTYDDAHLPFHGGLVARHLQLFLKSLRRRVRGVRYFACGEYGEQSGRAHYHALLFNLSLDERIKVGEDSFSSPLLSKVWRHGANHVRVADGASIAYTAGYCSKKLGRRRDSEVHERGRSYCSLSKRPEFSRMSLKPAIGQGWYDRFKSDLRLGYVVQDGAKAPVPRFYQKKFVVEFPELAEDLAWSKYLHVQSLPALDEGRLSVEEVVAVSRRAVCARRGDANSLTL